MLASAARGAFRSVSMSDFALTEIAAAVFQAVVALGLTGLFLFLFVRHRRLHFFWWAVAWALYALRTGAIISFLFTGSMVWLYAHQVATGWTALALLWASQVFYHQRTWRPIYATLLLFPLAWSYLAIFRLENFLLAAGPAVVFLSLTTLWTGVVFWQYRRRSGSGAAAFLAGTLVLWGIHHLDYPILRAKGAWSPWGYYLDTLFLLAIGTGVLLLVLEEFRQGLRTLTALSGDLQQRDQDAALEGLLTRPLALPGVRGAAVYQCDGSVPVLVRGVGVSAGWSSEVLPAPIRRLVDEVIETGHSRVQAGLDTAGAPVPFAAVLPLAGPATPPGALLMVGDEATPFTALDDSILVAVGSQIGVAIENAELYAGLAERTADLERLSVRMIRQHEEQRGRLARELHDETAQLFSALKLQVGSLREAAASELAPRFGRLVDLVDAGTRSIRRVTDDLRPAVLDDLGLVPAIRALVSDFRQWSGLTIDFSEPEESVSLSPAAELALFRAVQEGLSNVARHAQAERVTVALRRTPRTVQLTITDDGVGVPGDDLARLTRGPGRSGLFGLRERIAAEAGEVRIESSGGGFRIYVELPLVAREEG